ncbi:hypothetical protein [Streptomyces fuscus]|nr:hypothetical protein [Streptomyces fuscus]
MEAMRRVAAEQARLLRKLLPGPAHEVPAHIPQLFPRITVETVAHLPAPGITYWANGSWHIHVCESDSNEEQAFTVLHQMKHIIDHPIRQAATGFSASDWDALARHFAIIALGHESEAASP